MKPRLRRNSASSIPHACRRGSSGSDPRAPLGGLPMHRRTLAALAASLLALVIFGVTGARADEYHVTGPVVHDNPAIYLAQGRSAAEPVPLTLDEALAKRAVKVHETGNVNELQVSCTLTARFASAS